MSKSLLPLILLVFVSSSVVVLNARAAPYLQIVDRDFNSQVSRPAYIKEHPRVLFDEAHNNADTASGRYKPFVELITNDGYAVAPNQAIFSKEALKRYRVLVIVNATARPGDRDASAFTTEECAGVQDWVKSGGALLLITDQAPFSTAVLTLAARFDVSLSKGYTIDSSKYNRGSDDRTELVFSREDGLIGDHPICNGRDQAERVNRIMTFTGTSLRGPSGSVALLKLADTAMDVLPPDRPPLAGEQELDYKTVSAAGRAQAVALQFGKGRVVLLTEAAMLTAQVAPRGFQFGMNVPGLDNRQLALNIIHWLSGLLR